MGHAFWLWIYNNAPTLQVVLGAVAIVLSTLALIGLAFYTFYTRSQVRLTQAQVENMSRPVLVVEAIAQQLFITNVGTGPALNVEYVQYIGATQERQRFETILGAGARLLVGSEKDFVASHLLEDEWVFRVSYVSVSGIGYDTCAEWDRHREGLPLSLRIIQKSDPTRANKRRLS